MVRDDCRRVPRLAQDSTATHLITASRASLGFALRKKAAASVSARRDVAIADKQKMELLGARGCNRGNWSHVAESREAPKEKGPRLSPAISFGARPS